MEVLSLSMVKVSKESVDNKGTITNHTAAVSFFGLSDFFFFSFQCYCIPYNDCTLEYIGPYLYQYKKLEVEEKAILVPYLLGMPPHRRKEP